MLSFVLALLPVGCRYVDISDSIYPDRYPVLIKEQQLIKVCWWQAGRVWVWVLGWLWCRV